MECKHCSAAGHPTNGRRRKLRTLSEPIFRLPRSNLWLNPTLVGAVNNRTIDDIGRAALQCRDTAERARRLAGVISLNDDRDRLLRFAEEQEQRATELEAMIRTPSTDGTFVQQQLHVGPERKNPKG